MAVGSFSAALSGLNANAAKMNVIGNNLANINTVGFKTSSMNFQDLMSQIVSGSSGSPLQIGLGVTVGSVTPVFSQGAIENSRIATNVAIQGAGFFVVSGPAGLFYTRAGNFGIDDAGNLVTSDGYRVQGWTTVDPQTGQIVSSAQMNDIRIPPGVLRPPAGTTEFSTATNLDARAATGTVFATGLQVYDSLGESHALTVTYTKTGPSTWNYKVEANGADVVGGTPGTPYQVASGSVGFDANGQLASFTIAAPGTGGGAAPNIADAVLATPAWSNGAPASTLTWNLVDQNGAASLTGFAATSATSTITQNGNAAGTIDNIAIGSDGTILADSGGGQTIAVGQLALATFNNPQGLVHKGYTRYGESQASGLPIVGVAGTGGRGTLVGSALEQSNVDIAEEFTQMILAQRGYQANARTITASDELLAETLNLKR
ncbi:MAG: flagellar hook protein FlgE [Acidobacteriota bacterium]